MDLSPSQRSALEQIFAIETKTEKGARGYIEFRIIYKLEGAGYIKYDPSAADPQTKYVTTEAGKRKLGVK